MMDQTFVAGRLEDVEDREARFPKEARDRFLGIEDAFETERRHGIQTLEIARSMSIEVISAIVL